MGAPVRKASASRSACCRLIGGPWSGAAVPCVRLIALAVIDRRVRILSRTGPARRTRFDLKFRPMRVGADAEKHTLSHINHTGDSRCKIPRTRACPLGRCRRGTDEFPLWNVLWGDMSLGTTTLLERFRNVAGPSFRRLDAKPGITGLWQVSGRSSVVDFEDVVYLDRQYIEQWTFWLDVSIMARTLPAVVRRTGAY